MSDEREILFGLLALQNQRVTREELIAAIEQWAPDKSRPLAEILRGRGALTLDVCETIEPIVDLHIQQHGNSPQQSLATLSSLQDLTSVFEKLEAQGLHHTLLRIDDPALQTQQMSIVEPEESEAEEEPLSTSSPTRFTEHGTLLSANFEGTAADETFIKSERPVKEPSRKASSSRSEVNSRFIPRYRLGVGGQGEVWLAHDPELDRFVALKIIKPTERKSQDTIARFWREAELTGKLEHPNIVPVYEAESGRNVKDGTSRSTYYAMRVFGNRHLLEAITAFFARPRQEGETSLLDALKALHEKRNEANEKRLDQAINRFDFDDTQECDQQLRAAIAAFRADATDKSGSSLQDAIQAFHEAGRPNVEFRELLNRFIDICNAMGYAHSRGVIHRDLKPQNVMLGEFGETLVVDWGLAKLIGHKEDVSATSTVTSLRMSPDEATHGTVTRVGTVSGTLAYMPPEQASGKVNELGPAADIYSLGGILYAIITGKPPRSDLPITKLLEIAQSGAVDSPSKLRSDTPKPLEAICLKALSKAPSDRYPTANALADDVSRWLADEPVSAWREPFLIRARRWVKHHQTVVGSTAAAVVMAVAMLTALVAVVSSKNSELAGLNSSLDNRNQELVAAGLLLNERLGRLDLERGHRELQDGRIEDGWAYITQAAREIPADSELHDTIANYWSVPQSPLVSVIDVGGEVHAVAVNPEGNTIATGSSEGVAQLWDVATGALIGERWEHPGPVRAIAFHPGGDLVATGCDDGFVRLWSVKTGAAVGEPLQQAGAVGAIAFSPDGSQVVAGCEADTVQLWDVDSGTSVGDPWLHDSPVRAVAFSPTGDYVLTGNLYGVARLWKVATGAAVGDPWQHGGPVNAAAFSPDGLRVVTGCGDGAARLWDVDSGLMIGEPWSLDGPVNAVAFTPDGRYVVTGNFVDAATLWDVATGSIIGEKWVHHRPVDSVACSPEGRFAVTGSGDGKLRVWDLDAATAINEPWQHDGPVRGIAYHQDGDRVLSGSTDGFARLWSIASGELLGEPWAHDGPVECVAFSPDGLTAITGSLDGMVRLWDLETGKVIGNPWLNDGPVNTVAFSPDGMTVVTGSWIGSAQLWDVASGEKIGEPWPHPDWVRCVAYSPNNRHVLTGCGTAVNPNGFAQLWDSETGTPIGEPWVHGGPVVAVAFNFDGTLAATGCVDGFARLWDVATGTMIGEPWKHSGSVSAVAFSPNGQRLVTVCLNLVQMWDVPTGTLIGTLFGRENTVEDVAFSPDGGRVAIGFSDAQGVSGFVKLWDAARPFHALLPEGQFGRTLADGQLHDLSNSERVEIWKTLYADEEWRAHYDEYQERRWKSFLVRSAASAEQDRAWYAMDFYLRKLLTETDGIPNTARRHLLARLGNANQRLERPDDALAFYNELIDVILGPMAIESVDADSRRELMLAYYRSGQAHQALDQHEAARASFEAAGGVLREMIADEMSVEESARQLAVAEKAAAGAETAHIALDDWDALLLRPADELPALLEFRGIELLRRSRFNDAAQAAVALRDLATVNAEGAYTAARILSLCASGLDGRAEGGQSESESQQREVWIEQSLRALNRAIAIGWKDYEHMRTNSDLEILRNQPAFERLLTDPPPPSLPR